VDNVTKALLSARIHPLNMADVLRYSQQHVQMLSRQKPIRYTTFDDQLYEDFRKVFPHLDVRFLPEPPTEEFKSKMAELVKRWYTKVPRADQATLLRTRNDQAYTSGNVIIVCRLIFYVIEIARQHPLPSQATSASATAV
jgi:hypothetical protein